MKVGGILSEKEATNFLLGKVGDPHITSYVNHVARKKNGNRRAQHAIVPDIHAMNFPAGKQSINDSGSSRVADAIFEVKISTACKSRYAHNNIRLVTVDRIRGPCGHVLVKTKKEATTVNAFQNQPCLVSVWPL